MAEHENSQQESFDELTAPEQEEWQSLKERNPDLGALASFNLTALRRRERFTIVLLLVVLAALLLVVFKQSAINNDLNQQVDAIHNTQVNVCKASLEAGGVRFILAQQIRTQEQKTQRQLDQSDTFDYSKFFPNVPKSELDDLIAQQKKQLTREINDEQSQVHDLLAIDCSLQYRL